MNRCGSNRFSRRRLAGGLAGVLLAAAGSLLFLGVSSHTAVVAKSETQGLAEGKLAYVLWQVGMSTSNRSLGLASADGTAVSTLVSPTNPGPREPDWSPDGTKIVYAQNIGGSNDIYVVDALAGGPIKLTHTTNVDELDPSWSISGKIAYEAGGIWTMNADGSGQAQFAAITRPNPTDPVWSADGTKLAFVSSGEVWVINSNGTDQHQVTNNATVDSDPTWSPDGTKIMFAKQSSGLSVINADGSNETPVTTGTVDHQPAWSPDGSSIAFRRTSANPGIYTMAPNGSNQNRILVDGRTSLPCCDLNNMSPAWQRGALAVTRTAFDFDGDGRSDPAIFRSVAGDWWYLASSDGSQRASHWGTATDVLTPADFDGDLKTDFAVWRPSDGNFYIVNSSDATVRVENFGLAGDVPTGGDFDGDGRADVAVYRPGTQGTFYYRGSMGNPQGNITFIPWGMTGDKPIAGDYDGDGRTDAAIYRPSNGTWYIRQSSNGQLLAAGFGISTDKIVPADYDGDGRTDLAVYRDGVWYLYQWTEGFLTFQFGIAGDIPTPADYTGDGKAEAAVFRNGVWWIFDLETGTAQTVQFGVGTDSPVQAAFVR